jgi:3-isopropylmalate/(R)-2-methylmalate dehydratase small subunit
MSDIFVAQFSGRGHVYGDNIDTDRIIAGKYTKTLDTADLARHVLEDLDPEFAKRVRPGDILVAGSNFGCGSSREQAPIALKAAGITAVIAQSFARIFFRNAINIGLPSIEIGEHEIPDGADLKVDLRSGRVEITRPRLSYLGEPLPAMMFDILEAGGLISYLAERG